MVLPGLQVVQSMLRLRQGVGPRHPPCLPRRRRCHTPASEHADGDDGGDEADAATSPELGQQDLSMPWSTVATEN
eukprot:8174376-Prorocentrum_lima.AAC.1